MANLACLVSVNFEPCMSFPFLGARPSLKTLGKVRGRHDDSMESPMVRTTMAKTSEDFLDTPISSNKSLNDNQKQALAWLQQKFSSAANMTSSSSVPGTPTVSCYCNNCGQEFETVGLLVVHVSQVHGAAEKSRECSFCHKQFKVAAMCVRHERTHTGEKPFSCGVCRASFPQGYTLTRHLRSHTNEIPFQCRFCGKGFKRSDRLTEHVRSHTGIPSPYF